MKEDRVVDVCLPFLLCQHSVRERTDDDVSFLREQGAQRYANTYVDRELVFIGRTLLGLTPSPEYISTDKYI